MDELTNIVTNNPAEDRGSSIDGRKDLGSAQPRSLSAGEDTPTRGDKSSHILSDHPSAKPKTDQKGRETTLKGKKSTAAKKSSSTSAPKTAVGREKTGARDLDELNSKIDKLTDIVGSVVPIVKELKTAYDEARTNDAYSLDPDNRESGESGDEEEPLEPPAKKAKDSPPDTNDSEGGLLDSLVLEVTGIERTGPALPEKIVTAVNSILASGLSEQIAATKMESINRPENCNLLKITKVNQEIWDIALKQTRTMDARLQKMQELLIKGLISTAQLAGCVGDALEGTKELPDVKTIWEDLSNGMVLTAAANHMLNMCRRDMFKADLDPDYKASRRG